MNLRLGSTLAVLAALFLISNQVSANSEDKAKTNKNSKTNMYISLQAGGAVPLKNIGVGAISFLPDIEDRMQKKPKNSFVIDAVLGRQILNGFSAELELAHSLKHKYNYNLSEDIVSIKESGKARIRSTSLFINGRYKHEINKFPLVPYITAGVGYAQNKISNFTVNLDRGTVIFPYKVRGKATNNFAWQVGVGGMFPLIKDRLYFDIGYKYRDLGKVKSSNNVIDSDGVLNVANDHIVSGRLRTSNVLAGVSLNF